MNDKFEELLTFYALGALTEEERAQVEAYVASDPEAKRRLDEMIRTAAALPFAAAPVQTSQDLKRRVMDRINADAQRRFASPQPADIWTRFLDLLLPRAGNWAPHAIAVLSLIAALVTGTWGLTLRGQYASLQTEITALRQELALQREVIAKVASPNSQAFALAGTEHQPAAHGQLIADTQTGSALLLVSGLAQLETGNTYEFWLIEGSTPVPAGLFTVDEEGNGILQVSQNVTPGALNAIGVSIEPEGGSLQPTGNIVMLSEIQ